MPSNHLILCRPPLLQPSIFPSIRVFSNESVLRMRWPKYWSFSFSFSPSNEYSGYLGLISFRRDWLDLLAVQETLKSLLQHHIYYTYIKLFVYNLVCCNKLFQYPPAASVCWDKPLRRSCVFLHILEAQTCWPSFASDAVCRQTTLWNRHSVSLWSKGRFTDDKYINKDSAAFWYKVEASFLATPWKVWGFWSLHSCDVYYLRVQHPPKSPYHHPPPRNLLSMGVKDSVMMWTWKPCWLLSPESVFCL